MSIFQIYTVIDVICFILLYLIYFVPRWGKTAEQLFLKTCLYVYLCFVMYFTLIIPVIIPLPFVNMNPSNITVNLVPFYDLLSGNGNAMREVALNIFMFVPFGILYPFIYHKAYNRTMLSALLLTLGIEAWQLISARNLSSCDITDVINNLIGAMLGYGIYLVFRKPANQLLEKIFKGAKGVSYHVTKRIQIAVFVCILLQLFVRSIMVSQF